MSWLRSDKPMILRTLKTRLGEELAGRLASKLTVQDLGDLYAALETLAGRCIALGREAGELLGPQAVPCPKCDPPGAVGGCLRPADCLGIAPQETKFPR